MKVFMIASKDVVIRFRDRKGLMLMVLMPLLLTAILGAALSDMIGGDQKLMPKMTISVYSEDNGELARRLVDDVLQSEELKPYIKIKMLRQARRF
jgi:ABC-2 type transport system permease protein